MQNYSVESDESCSVESDESFCSVESAAMPVHYAPNYEAGDLVWAKVKSHPWWPGQIFNVFYASEEARCLEKPGKLLVAFYGDHTFAWLDHSQILEFKPSFVEKAKATNTQLFQDALSEVLDEVCGRAQLGLECQCGRSEWDNDADDGVQGTLRQHKDVSMSKETLDARKTLGFLKKLASSPCNPASISSVNAAALRGRILGIRTGIAAHKGKYETLDDWRFSVSTCKDDSLEEAVLPSVERADIGASGAQSQIECRKCGNVGYNKRVFPLEDSERANKRSCVGEPKVDNEEKARAINFRGAAGQRACSKIGAHGLIGSTDEASNRQTNMPGLSGERLNFFREVLEQNTDLTTSLSERPSACWDARATHSLMQISDDLHYVAVDPLSYHGSSYNTTVRNMAAIFKFRDLVFQTSAGYGYHLESEDQEEMKMRDKPPQVGIPAGGNDSSKLVPIVARYWWPTIQRQRTLCPHMNRLENLEARDSTKAQPHSQHAAPTKTCHEGKKLSFDREGMVSGTTSFEAVSGAHSQAWEKAFSQKLDVHDLLIRAHKKTSDITKDAPAQLGMHEKNLMEAQKRKSGATKEAHLKLDVHELLVEAQKKKSVHAEEDPPLKVLGKATKTSAPGGDANEKVSEDAPKVSVFEGKFFSDANSESKLLADDFARANSDEGIPVERFSEATPGIEIPDEKKSTSKCHFWGGTCMNDQNMEEVCDKRGSPTQLHGNAVSSTKRQHDDEACSRTPVSLFMKFPRSVSLPLKTQLNVMFAAFGALDTRVHRDTASAQVIFKHRDEAEAAYKCVKLVSPFGKAPVSFRLQHLSHS